MSSTKQYDVVVIGGGPAGMMAAGRAAECGRRVLLVEKNKDVGKKLSITGGGRCNILNAEEDTRKLIETYGDAAKFLHSPFAQFGMQDAWDFFDKRGVPIVVEARKRAFPESQEAKDVMRAMKAYVTQNHVELWTGTKATGFKEKGGKIVALRTSRGDVAADSYILASGGSSHPETGSTGEGIEWLRELGHTTHEASPNIVPLKVKEQWVKNLSGNTLTFMKITFGSNLTKEQGRFSKTGKILFTHFGLSGPLILNSAHQVKELLRGSQVQTEIDMYPDTEVGTLRNRVLEVFNVNKNKELKNVLKEFVPHGMTDAVATLLGEELQHTKVHSVSKDDRNQLVDLLKAMPLTVSGTMGLDWAVISDGGVDLREIDMKTMRSNVHDNLFFTGDVLNINRPSGGFSLQLCWTTGFVAGSHA